MNKFSLLLTFALFISGCDQKPAVNPINQKAADALVQQSLNNMVDIQGGSFMMGDFGPLVGGKSYH